MNSPRVTDIIESIAINVVYEIRQRIKKVCSQIFPQMVQRVELSSRNVAYSKVRVGVCIKSLTHTFLLHPIYYFEDSSILIIFQSLLLMCLLPPIMILPETGEFNF